jgi:hypothetical protein
MVCVNKFQISPVLTTLIVIKFLKVNGFLMYKYNFKNFKYTVSLTLSVSSWCIEIFLLNLSIGDYIDNSNFLNRNVHKPIRSHFDFRKKLCSKRIRFSPILARFRILSSFAVQCTLAKMTFFIIYLSFNLKKNQK